MSYVVDKTEQLAEAVKKSRFGSIASLRNANTPTRQHNVGVKKAKKAAKKSASKSSDAKVTAKKTTAKKTAKKS